jgi:2-phosphosulfolactate phosphatase
LVQIYEIPDGTICYEVKIIAIFTFKSQKMKIEILEFVEGARKAKGIAVIIDVFRAFSVACYAADAGAVRIIATAEVSDAFKLKKEYKNSVLVGERDEKKIEGFDFGNSPTEIIRTNLSGKTVIHTTTAGTQGLVNATNADAVLTGSFVNAGAIIKYIRAANPEIVSLVAMGYRAATSADEDLMCAEMIANELKNKKVMSEVNTDALRNSTGKRFFDPVNIDFSPPTDFFLCTMLNRFSFVLKATRRFDGNVDLMQIDM